MAMKMGDKTREVRLAEMVDKSARAPGKPRLNARARTVRLIP